MLRKDGKIELLKHVPLFSHCNKKQLAAIASIADLVELPADTLLIREGALGREFMVIAQGAVAVSARAARSTSSALGTSSGKWH